MKYVIRRLIVSALSIPFVAGAYTFVYLALIVLGADPAMSLAETFSTGINIAIALAFVLLFFPQISKFVNKLI
jgi:hypothetical protein